MLEETKNQTVNSTHSNDTDNSTGLKDVDFAIISGYIGLVGLLGFLGNLLVIITFWKFKSLRTSTNTFVVHLAVCNFVLAMLDLTFSLPSAVKHSWLFDADLCRFYGFVYFFFSCMSLNTLAVISLDRYWVITKPSIGIKITIKRAVFCAFLTYLYTFFYTLPVLIGWIDFQEDAFYTGCYLDFQQQTVVNLTYSVILTVFLFLVPLVIMIYCYYSIFSSVRSKGQYGVHGHLKNPGKYKPPSRKLHHWRTARMIVVVVLMFLLCWSPYVVVSLFLAFSKLHIPRMALEVTILLTKSGVIYNPFIYAALNHRFRTAFYEMFCCDKWKVKRRTCTVTQPNSSHRTSRNNTSLRTLALRGGSEKSMEKEPSFARRKTSSCEHRMIDIVQRSRDLGDGQSEVTDLKERTAFTLQTRSTSQLNDSGGTTQTERDECAKKTTPTCVATKPQEHAHSSGTSILSQSEQQSEV